MSDKGNLLLSPHTRKWFFVSGITTLLVFVGIRYFVIPHFYPDVKLNFFAITSIIVDNFIVALVSALSISLIILWLNPPALGRAVVKVVGPFELKNVLNNAFGDIKEFWYVGHTAKWTRSVTLKKLSNYAKNNNVSIDVFIVILDPNSNSSSCYNAEFHKRFVSKYKNIESLIRKNNIELFTTIVSLFSWKQEQPLLNIQLALTDKVSLFRIDLYSKFALITQADPRAPGLKYEMGSLFYNSYREEARIRFHQSRKISDSINGVSFNELNHDKVKKLLSSLEFNISDISNSEIDEIIDKARNPKSPY